MLFRYSTAHAPGSSCLLDKPCIEEINIGMTIPQPSHQWGGGGGGGGGGGCVLYIYISRGISGGAASAIFVGGAAI